MLRPNLDYRGYTGQIVSGVIRKGDEIAVYPSGKQSTVAGIDTFDGELDVAYAPMSVTLRLNDELHLRGDTLASPKSPLRLSRRLRRGGLDERSATDPEKLLDGMAPVCSHQH